MRSLFFALLISMAVPVAALAQTGAPTQSFSNATLRQMDFSHRPMAGADFSNADITDVTFEGSVLSGASFRNVSFEGCNFRGADLSGADFSNASLENCDLRGAIVIGTSFRNADFEGTKINGVDFSRADVSNANFDGADYATAYTVSAESISRQLTQTGGVPVSSAAPQYHETPSINLSIHFAFDSDKLESDAWEQLAELSKALNGEALKSSAILIEGHTDSKGEDAYNVDLSYRRAATVMRTLSERFGVDVSRLSIKGYGEQRPVAGNDTDFGRAQNRRVTIVNLSAK